MDPDTNGARHRLENYSPWFSTSRYKRKIITIRFFNFHWSHFLLENKRNDSWVKEAITVKWIMSMTLYKGYP